MQHKMSLLCATLLLVLGSKATSERIETCHGQRDRHFNDKMSDKYAFQVGQARSSLECATRCQTQESCQSYFYVRETGLCQLHSDVLNAGDTMEPMTSARYYIMCKERRNAPIDCKDILTSGGNISGVYRIFPHGNDTSYDVYCDQTTDGGGWVVFLRREDGSVDFYRTWSEYEDGFGSLTGEFWIGLPLLHYLTSRKPYELLVQLENFNNEKRWAAYNAITVSDSSTFYVLTLGNYTGDAGDSLKYEYLGHYVHSDVPFSTKDRDHSGKNCSISSTGGFWYDNKGGCQAANPTGLYHDGGSGALIYQCIEWKTWTGRAYSLKKVEMKIRRKN